MDNIKVASGDGIFNVILGASDSLTVTGDARITDFTVISETVLSSLVDSQNYSNSTSAFNKEVAGSQVLSSVDLTLVAIGDIEVDDVMTTGSVAYVVTAVDGNTITITSNTTTDNLTITTIEDGDTLVNSSGDDGVVADGGANTFVDKTDSVDWHPSTCDLTFTLPHGEVVSGGSLEYENITYNIVSITDVTTLVVSAREEINEIGSDTFVADDTGILINGTGDYTIATGGVTWNDDGTASVAYIPAKLSLLVNKFNGVFGDIGVGGIVDGIWEIYAITDNMFTIGAQDEGGTEITIDAYDDGDYMNIIDTTSFDVVVRSTNVFGYLDGVPEGRLFETEIPAGYLYPSYGLTHIAVTSGVVMVCFGGLKSEITLVKA